MRGTEVLRLWGHGVDVKGAVRKRPPLSPATTLKLSRSVAGGCSARREHARRAMLKERTSSSVVAIVSAVLAVVGALGALYVPVFLH